MPEGHWFSLPFYTSNPLSSSAVIIIYAWIQFPTGFKGLDKCMFIRIALNKEKCVQFIINIAKGICKRPGGLQIYPRKIFRTYNFFNNCWGNKHRLVARFLYSQGDIHQVVIADRALQNFSLLNLFCIGCKNNI